LWILVQEKRKLERYTPPNFLAKFSLFITEDDPRIVREAVDTKDGKLYKKAMVEEIVALDKNEVWDLVELLTGINPIGKKWVFKEKLNVEGKVEKYKDQ
jgi:hypothetical protein